MSSWLSPPPTGFGRQSISRFDVHPFKVRSAVEGEQRDRFLPAMFQDDPDAVGIRDVQIESILHGIGQLRQLECSNSRSTRINSRIPRPLGSRSSRRLSVSKQEGRFQFSKGRAKSNPPGFRSKRAR